MDAAAKREMRARRAAAMAAGVLSALSEHVRPGCPFDVADLRGMARVSLDRKFCDDLIDVVGARRGEPNGGRLASSLSVLVRDGALAYAPGCERGRVRYALRDHGDHATAYPSPGSLARRRRNALRPSCASAAPATPTPSVTRAGDETGTPLA